MVFYPHTGGCRVNHSSQSPLSITEANAFLTAPGAIFEMETVQIRGQELRVWKNAPPTLREVFVATEQFAGRDFVIYEEERLSFADHYRAACVLGHAFIENFGVEKGDRIAIAMRSCPEAVVSFWASAIVGAVVVPVNAWWQGDELHYALVDSGARVLVADSERLQRVHLHRHSLPHLQCILVRSDQATYARTYDALLREHRTKTYLPR